MRVVAVALSRVKGVPKDPVERVRLLRDSGVEGDAHAGPGPRQVSLLALPSIRVMEERFGAPLGFGRFAENVVVDAPLAGVEVGDLVGLGRAVLEVTALGKECHKGCAIRAKTGDCIMPREGVFARVMAGGEVRAGHLVRVVRPARDLAVVVLAGGRSRRFGSDKRFARTGNGRMLIEAAVETARAVTPEVWLSVGAGESVEGSGVRVIPDEVPDAGPLGGVVTCLRRCRAPIVAVFAVDQPGVTPDLLRVLAVRNDGPGTCLEWRGGLHPVPCVLGRDVALPALERALSGEDRALHRAWERAGVRAVDAGALADLGDPEALLANWNRPEDVLRTSVGEVGRCAT